MPSKKSANSTLLGLGIFFLALGLLIAGGIIPFFSTGSTNPGGSPAATNTATTQTKTSTAVVTTTTTSTQAFQTTSVIYTAPPPNSVCGNYCQGSVTQESCYLGCQVNLNVLIILESASGAPVLCTSGETNYGANICNTGSSGYATFQVLSNSGPIAACVYSSTTGNCVTSWSDCFSGASSALGNCVTANVATGQPITLIIQQTPSLSVIPMGNNTGLAFLANIVLGGIVGIFGIGLVALALRKK
ncbi:MAG: hypothetical protein M1587_09580 [Thaumarchaeota archaeon]|nr:hypothetical protein [Nitrososphaerota archaeon]